MKKILLLALLLNCTNPTNDNDTYLDLPKLKSTCNEMDMTYNLYDLKGKVNKLNLITHPQNGDFFVPVCTSTYIFDQSQNLIRSEIPVIPTGSINRTFTYNISNKIEKMEILDSKGNTESKYNYSYDINDNLVRITDDADKILATYTYSQTTDNIISNELSSNQSCVRYYDHDGTCLKIEWPSSIRYFNEFGKIIKDSLTSSLHYSTYVYNDENFLDTVFITKSNSTTFKKYQYFDFDSLNNYQMSIITEINNNSLEIITIDTLFRYITYH